MYIYIEFFFTPSLITALSFLKYRVLNKQVCLSSLKVYLGKGEFKLLDVEKFGH